MLQAGNRCPSRPVRERQGSGRHVEDAGLSLVGTQSQPVRDRVLHHGGGEEGLDVLSGQDYAVPCRPTVSRASRASTSFRPRQAATIMLPVVETAFLHLDNRLGLILLYVMYGLGFNIFIFTAYIKSIPRELEEAAAIDGASTWGVFWRVIFPQPSAS